MTDRYALVGINDEETTCAICGKVELKRVMWLVALDEDGNKMGDAFACGTTCGAKMLKGRYNAAKLATLAKNYEYEVYRQRQALMAGHAGYLRYGECLQKLNAMTLDYSERMNHPLMAEAKAAKAEAESWAAAQAIIIEL